MHQQHASHVVISREKLDRRATMKSYLLRRGTVSCVGHSGQAGEVNEEDVMHMFVQIVKGVEHLHLQGLGKCSFK